MVFADALVNNGLTCGGLHVISEPPLDAPDEEWLVWADAMQQIGDPRGELIAFANHPRQLAAHVRQHANQLFGSTIGHYVREGTMRVTWRRAVPDLVEVRIDRESNGPAMLAELVHSPIAPRMRGVTIAAIPPPQSGRHQLEVLDLTPTLGWFREMEIPRNWTSLALIDDRARAVDHMLTRDFEPEANLVTFGPLPTLWPAVPHLEELHLVVADPGQVQFGTIRLPALRSFALDCLYWAEGTGQLLARAEWPKLTSIALRFVEDFTVNDPDDTAAYRQLYRHYPRRDHPFESRPRDFVDREDDLRPLFESLQDVPLERLALTSFQDTNLVLTMLEQHAFPELLELDLSDSAIDTAGLERLAESPLLAQVCRLVLERVAAPSAMMFSSRNLEVRHSYEPRAPTYRYVVGWE